LAGFTLSHLQGYDDGKFRTIGVNYALPFVSWTNVEPIQGKYDWYSLDYLYRPAEMNRMGYTLNGHCMIFFLDEWWNLPQYVRSMNFQQLKEAIQKHVQTLVTHYKGIITYWTINEPTFSYSDFFKLSQAQWIEVVSTAVQSVRKSDPEAKIMINVVPADHPEIGYSPHDILDALIGQGVEFDVIGIELYPRPEFGIVPDVNGYPSIEWASTMLDSFARFGKPIILSEVAVTNVPSPEAQANWLRAFYTMAFEKPFVVGITWYFVDDDPYLPGAGLFPDVDSPPRPVYEALADVIRERTSQGTTKTDSEGRVKIEGYAGDYLIEVGIGARKLRSCYISQKEKKARLNVPSHSFLTAGPPTGPIVM
jgi:GH35 family endo-1,4-beta-xylanase